MTGDRFRAAGLSEDSQGAAEECADEAEDYTNDAELSDKHVLHLLPFFGPFSGRLTAKMPHTEIM